jgi:D-cysteine desulfhydrase
VSGTLGYIHAVAELIGQIRSGAVPEPDIIVVAVGSGGTAAGLIAGVLREGLRSCVHGVSVAAPAMLMRPAILGLALAALRRDGGSPDLLRLNAVLSLTDAERGPGYGVQTERGQAAGRVAESLGLELDPTYTEKGFAAALDLAGHPDWRRNRATMSLKWLNFRPPLRILYWHTLSSTPLDRLLVADPSLSSELQRLLPRR